MSKNVVEIMNADKDQDAFVLELQRLVLCYQEASRDDRNVVWAALNKYASKIDRLK